MSRGPLTLSCVIQEYMSLKHEPASVPQVSACPAHKVVQVRYTDLVHDLPGTLRRMADALSGERARGTAGQSVCVCVRERESVCVCV